MSEPRRHPSNGRAVQKKLQAERDLKNAVFAATDPLTARIRALEFSLKEEEKFRATVIRERDEAKAAAGQASDALRQVTVELDAIRARRALSDAELLALAADVFAEGRPMTPARQRMLEELQRRGVHDGVPGSKDTAALKSIVAAGVAAVAGYGVYGLYRDLFRSGVGGPLSGKGG